ncbi:hypothetical protein CRG98_011549 [Punica granatum]|uniref:Uncharacterized protein n=1 Tax=Punica granatum TaxID=22663 RepID=A0A2I0KIF3_PUNGR|nr:hypothetical protein CRG98_011549 [Punica granatum]
MEAGIASVARDGRSYELIRSQLREGRQLKLRRAGQRREGLAASRPHVVGSPTTNEVVGDPDERGGGR